MELVFGATERDFENCVLILREITGEEEVRALAMSVLNIVGAKGGDYSVETIRAFAEAYLKSL